MSTTSEVLAQALQHHREGRLQQAEQLYRQVLALEPNHSHALDLLGVLAAQSGNREAAVDYLQRAIQADGNIPEYHNNLGFVLREMGELDRAEACYLRALQLRPEYAEVHNDLGIVYRDQKRSDAACDAFRRALALQPQYAKAHHNLGSALQDQARFDEAIDSFRRALALDPRCAEMHHSLGLALKEQGQVDEAIACYARALELDPQYIDAHCSRGFAWLSQGHWPQGFPEYEWRWRSRQFAPVPREFRQPLWQGESLYGKTILLHAEQGLGDTLQFSRYAALVQQRGARVVLECQPVLCELLSRLPGVSQVVAAGSPLPAFDVQAPLMSLPGIMRTTVSTVPAQVPYLTVDSARVEQWQRILSEVRGFKVGIAWQGNPQFKGDHLRSIPLRYYEPLAQSAGVTLISLQQGLGTEQLQALAGRFSVWTHSSQTGLPRTFGDTAALMRNLDLVITSDTSVAHLAGALGVPTWVALPFAADWRWLQSREDCPWYPTLRLFRQTRDRDWGQVFQRIARALAERISAGGAPATVARFATVASSAASAQSVPAASSLPPAVFIASAPAYVPPAPVAAPPPAPPALDQYSTPPAEAIQIAMQHHQAGRLDAAEPIYQRLLDFDSQHVGAWHLYGVLAAQRGQWELAVSRYERALDLAPTFAEAHNNLGNALKELGRVGAAVSSYRRALDLKPSYAEAHNNLGNALKDQGQLDGAVQCLQKAIELRPDYAEAHNNLGLALQERGQVAAAAISYRRALALNPNLAIAHYNLGTALQRDHDRNAAIFSYRRAVELSPGLLPAYVNLGTLLQEEGQLDAAVTSFRRALELKPDYAEAHHDLGLVLKDLGRTDEAFASFRRAIELTPRLAIAHKSLGRLLMDSGRVAEAIDSYRRALEIAPALADAHNCLGIALQDQGKLDEAEACYRRTLELTPDYAEAHSNLGIVLKERGNLDGAAACYRRALELKPEYAGAHNNLGNVLKDQGRFAEAIACYRRALVLKPDFAEVHMNLGSTLQDQGDLAAASACFTRALQLKPDHADVHCCRAVINLLTGELTEGWAEYEWRWKTKQFTPRNLPRPQWEGESIAGKTILLFAEQGLGDTIQFARYISLVRQLGARTLVECQPPLRPLLQRCPDIDQLIDAGSPVPEFDVHCPLLSLPRAFQTTLSTIPAKIPYFSPDPTLESRWREALAGISDFKIGIAWQGSPIHKRDRFRSIPLQEFAPLAACRGVALFSLQKGKGTEQIRAVSERFVVREFGSGFDEASGAFMDTAAVMKSLDLVITADSALAHLAGALGVPVWVALPHVPDWRWMLERSDSPWYPTLKLFRQRQDEPWASVFERMADALRQLRQERTT